MSATLFAVCLGLFSAITLAATNMSVKMGSDILVARAVLAMSAAILIFPAVFFVPWPTPAVWGALLFSLPAHFFYQICMVRALQRGDLSLVFPVMRGAAPLLTAVAALILLHEELAPLAWFGLLLATLAVAIFVLPPKGIAFRDHPHAPALFWALGTAVGIALYNVTDARGVRLSPNPLTYVVCLFLFDGAAIVVTALIIRRDAVASAIAMRWRYGVVGGALSILSFGAALYAFSLMETAKVSALRETSVVFAAAMGSLFLGEGFGRRRLIAAIILAAGLILMQFGR